MNKKRLLIILRNGVPYPLQSGGQQAVFHMIDNLRKEMNVHILYFANLNQKKAQQALENKWSDVKFYPYQNKSSIFKKFDWDYFFISKFCNRLISKMFSKNQAFKKTRLFLGWEMPNKDLLRLIKKIIDVEKIDIAQTEFFETLPFVYIIPEHVKKVFVHHEIRFIRNERLFEQYSDKNILDNYLLQKTKQEEITAMNNYDAIVTLTDTDKKILRDNGVKSNLFSSPALIPFDSKISSDYFFSNKIVFLGGHDHAPNIHGITWFLEFSWDIVVNNNPNISLQIIGNWPEEVKKEYENRYKNIEFLGFVPDLRTVLQDTIMIVPILVGSGMRMKILEAAIYGCPFITTSVGVEGLNFKNGKDCLIEDNPEFFAKRLLDLMLDKTKQLDLRKNAMQVIQKNYSKKTLIQKRLLIYNKLYNIQGKSSL